MPPISPVGLKLIESYSRAKALDNKLTKTEYMMRTFPHRYRSRDAAYQAYNKTTKGQRSGAALDKVAIEAQPPVRNEKLREQFRSGEKRRFRRPGGSQGGLWKVNIIYTVLNEDGEEQILVRSFIAESPSGHYSSLYDVKYLEVLLKDAADGYEARWLDMYEDDEVKLISNYIGREIEVVPIYKTQIQPEDRLDIDELTQIEGEDYEG